MARSIQLAEAVKNALNTDFVKPEGVEFEAVRSYAPNYNTKDLETLRVDVCLGLGSMELASRKDTLDEHTAVVSIEQLVDAARSNEAIDALVDLVQSMRDFFRFRSLAGLTWTGDQLPMPYDPEQLHGHRTFTSFFVLTYRETR